MAECICVIGESGSGKSTALRNLPMEKCVIISVNGRKMPFACKEKLYVTDNAEKIIQTFNWSNKKENIEYVIVDDAQYIMSNTWLNSFSLPKTRDSEFNLYKQIGYDMFCIIKSAIALNPNKFVIFLSHSETDENGKTRIKTIGKLLNEKITIEGLFDEVFTTVVHGDKPVEERFCFRTHTNGSDTTHTPLGMFEEDEVPNDLYAITETIKKFRK